MNRTHTVATLGVATALVALTLGWASTSEPDGASRAYLHAYNIPSSGIALDGYDPVSYFTDATAVPGRPQYASTYNDVTYLLASAEHKRLFDRDPQQYLPAYGGWCAFGMSIKDKFPVDPRRFKIVNGRLLLFLGNRDIDALALWNQGDEAQLLARADAHWATVGK